MRRYIRAAFAVLFLLSEIAQICFCANSTVPCVEAEREALVKFKASLRDLSNRLSSWKGIHCCQWEGIACDNVTGHVLKLNLRNPCVPPSWPKEEEYVTPEKCYDSQYSVSVQLEAQNVNSSLLQLEYLTYLDLSGNDFRGSPIPMFFGSMRRLEYLSLFSANFGGRIPSSLGNLKSLHLLDLSSNYELEANDLNWISKLESLEHLGMSAINLGDTHNLFQVLNMLPSLLRIYLAQCELHNPLIPLVNLTKLQVLDLRGNQLTLPALHSFQNFTSIEFLHLSYNNITSIPSWFRNFEKLVHLDLSSNGLHGPIPDAFRNLTSIEFLDLSYNGFTSIPSWFVELKSLVFVDLQQNKLTLMECSLSSILRNMCHLKSLYLSENKLRGEPFGHDEFFGCIRYDLEELYLSNNEFSDRLPTWLGQLESLVYIDLSSNFFHGPIPFSLGKLSNLVHLLLSNNKLNGTLPQSLGKLVNLEYINLSNNSFNGPIPQSLNEFVNLGRLDLSSNKFDRMISMGKEWSAIMPQLWYFNLSNNQITGSLPKNIGHIMPNLRNLILGNNLINGSIPMSLCQTELRNLDLSKNNLSGEIPNCWKDNQAWEEINLSYNKLSGVFPSSFGNLSSLSWLHLNHNSLQGRLPMYFRNLKQLLILDLGENQLSGSIPLWTRKTFPSLQILRLRQNMFSGKIPSQLCQLTSLKILDLSRNKLEGSIPWCIGNLRGMILNNSSHQANKEVPVIEALEPEWYKEEVKQVMKGKELDYIKILKLVVNLDLSENNLVGSIPNGITWLTGLHGLNLSNNHLKGEIPKKIGDMKSLESLDMSHNLLSGTIPNSLSALTSLSHLNLSHNNLSGPIPKDNQLLTLDDPSIYANNPYLCGSPLPNKCPGDGLYLAPERKGNEDDDGNKDKAEKVWFFFVITVGFATGFWGVIGALWFKKSFRHAYFRWVDEKADEIHVAMVIKMAKLKKLMVMRNRIHG